MFQPPMRFVPGVGLLPSSPIWRAESRTDQQYPLARWAGYPWQAEGMPLPTDGPGHIRPAGCAWHPG
jgi:hypothetical protein